MFLMWITDRKRCVCLCVWTSQPNLSKGFNANYRLFWLFNGRLFLGLLVNLFAWFTYFTLTNHKRETNSVRFIPENLLIEITCTTPVTMVYVPFRNNRFPWFLICTRDLFFGVKALVIVASKLSKHLLNCCYFVQHLFAYQLFKKKYSIKRHKMCIHLHRDLKRATQELWWDWTVCKF